MSVTNPHQEPLGIESTPIAVSTEEWQALSEEQRLEHLIEVNEVLTEQARLAPESRAHGRAKGAALDQLSQHFARIGRCIYLADDMAVHYSEQPVFVPDILAVLDVEDTGDDDQRIAWVVAEEGKGPDLVIEVLFRGDRGKDLVRNVAFYAQLGIGEYFVYDRKNQALQGWWLPPGEKLYQPKRPQLGLLASGVLGLNLAVVDGRLRFFSGAAVLPGSGEMIEQLGRMVNDLEERRALAEMAQERERAEQERERAERAREITDQERHRTLEELRNTIRRVLEARNLVLPEQYLELMRNQTEAEVLADWIVQAAVATTVDQVFKT